MNASQCLVEYLVVCFLFILFSPHDYYYYYLYL